ncbi:hypothetical protein QEN19_001694 [Hanseniaspora menglaensis]
MKKTYGNVPTCFPSFFHEVMFIFACGMSQLLNQGAMNQTLTLFKLIPDSLNSSSSENWLMASFTLAAGSSILVTGHMGDIYGLKKMVLVGFVISMFGGLIIGLSQYTKSNNQFIIGRALFQGLGVSFLVPNLMGIVGREYEVGSKRKFLVISILGANAPLGAAFATLFPGIITHSNEKNWPWAFYSYSILCFVDCFVVWKYVPPDRNVNIENLKLDYLGIIFGVYGLAGFNFSWNQAAVDGWNKSYNIVILVTSIISLIVFYYHEKKTTNPILDPKVINNYKVVMILVILLVGWGSFGISLNYLYEYYLVLEGNSSLIGGLKFIPFSIFGIIASLSVPELIRVFNPMGVLLLAGFGFTGGALCYSFMNPSMPYWALEFVGTCILSFGMDLSFPASSIVLSDLIPNGNSGSLVSTMTNYGVALFLGIGSYAEKRISAKHAQWNLLKQYRVGFYFAIGTGILACILSIIMIIDQKINPVGGHVEVQEYFNSDENSEDELDEIQKKISTII